ncbi:MAG: hypothetical protein ACKVU4_11285 [Phycisphaerales bacterium]
MSAALLAAAAGLAAPAAGQTYSWTAGNGWWGNGANWTPLGPPPSLDATILIGNVAGVQNSTVLMGAGIITVVYDHLEVSDGMTVDMNGSELVSFHEAWITGAGSRVIARPGAGPNQKDFQGDLRLGAGAFFELRDNVEVMFGYDGWSQGTILGRGKMVVGDLFANDGYIDPGNNGGLVLQSGYFEPWQTVNLDGTSGDGQLRLNIPFSVLEVRASALLDPFSGIVTMVPGALLTMDIDDGWGVDTGLINVIGQNNPAAASQIAGSEMMFGGTMLVGGAQGHLRVLAEAELEDSTSVIVGAGSRVEFDGATTVWGGEYQVFLNGALDFDAPTTMRGGSFSTLSAAAADGTVDFNGSTTWNGSVEIAGVARQMGNAMVLGPTVIDAEVFDMDGDGDTAWTIWNDLTVSVDSLQTDGGGAFNGTITVANGSLGCLEMNVAGINERFEMAGVMNLIGHPSVFSTRYRGGDTFELLGDLNVSGHVAFDGYLHAFDGTITIPDPDDVLRLDAGGLITGAAAFTGDGELWIASSPLLVDVDLRDVGLVNQGTLRVSAFTRADRYRAEPGSTWEVSLRGYEPGVTYDQLMVTAGDAAVAGTLEVEFHPVLPGGALFTPQVGDEFTILLAVGDVTGAFANDPVTVVGLTSYEWSVRYEPHAVVLRLDSIDSCYPDCNGDKALTVADFGCFQTKFVGGSPYAECNGDGVLTVADFGCFQGKYVIGCP